MEDFSQRSSLQRKATVIVGRLIFKEDKPVEATVAIGKAKSHEDNRILQ